MGPIAPPGSFAFTSAANAPGSKQMETELKLSLPVGARPRIDEHPALRSSRADSPVERHEVTTYFDTPDLTLERVGASLRVRRAGDSYVQTLKLRNSGHGAAARRGEWEWPIAQETPDLRPLIETPIAQMLPDIADMLEPIFVTDVHRTVHPLRFGDDTQAELDIDEGIISAGYATERVGEVEIELKEGALEPLYQLALELHADSPLGVAPESKAERGYRLRTGRPPAAKKASKLKLARDIDTHEGLRAIIGAGLGHLLSNHPAAILAKDAEGLHQMRVAIRRLRTALVMFDEHLEPRAAAKFEAELRQLGLTFGEARDWDVFVLETIPEAIENGVDGEWLGLLKAPGEAERQRAHRLVEDAAASPKFTGFVLALPAWTEGSVWSPPGRDRKAAARPLRALAPAMLDRLERKARKRGSVIAQRGPEELHALRKTMKKLRYGVEYLAGLYDSKEVKRYRRACEGLQEVLGTINDAAATERIAAKLAEEGRPDLVPPIGALAKWNEARRRKACSHLDKVWKEFRGATPFWH
jgi:triphosphatase